jgi:plastocyanin
MAKIPDLLPQQQLEKRDISQEVVQRVRKEAETHYGAFAIDDNDYKFDKDGGTKFLHINLKFTPNENANATKVGLTQVVKAQNNRQRSILEPHQEQRMTKNNYHVDQMSENRNPLYATDAAPEENQEQFAAYETTNGDHAIKEGDTWTSANLIDEPSVEGLVSCVRKFETAALAIEGEDEGKYYGSVQWGFQKVAGKSSKIEFKLVSKGVPSKNFMQAAEKWNNSKARGTGTITKDTMVMDKISTGGGGFQFDPSETKLKNGEQVKIAEGNVHGATATGKQYIKVSKIGGKIDAYTDSGYINIKHFKDNGDGEEVIPLPLVNVMINKKTTELYENQDQSGTSTPLAKKTRMEIIDNEGEELVKVRIVDGDNITQEGWIESAQLSAE